MSTPVLALDELLGALGECVGITDCKTSPDVKFERLSQRLFHVVEQGDVATARLLLSQGASPLWLNEEQETSLHAAAMGGHVDAIQVSDAFFSAANSTTDAVHLLSRQLLLDECRLAADCNPGATLECMWLGPDTPLTHAAAAGHVEAARLLLDRHADVNYRSFSAEGVRQSVLLAAVCAGQQGTAMLLSSYGATRHWLGGCSATTDSTRPVSSEEQEAALGGCRALSEWLVMSRQWTPLHHLESLTVARTRRLLREGASPSARGHARGTTPAERARTMLAGGHEGGGSSSSSRGGGSSSSSSEAALPAPTEEARRCAALVLQADGPWSPESHALRPEGGRRRACELLRMCYGLKRASAWAANMDNALLDVWIGSIIPSVLACESSTTQYLSEQHG